MPETRDYKYIEHTVSMCPVCMQKIDGKIIEKNGSVYILKYCKDHGEFCNIIEESADWFNNRKLYDKPGNKFTLQALRNKGCPFDCGLCPSHEQHTCIGLIEITSSCNLNCPLCFANSGKDEYLSMADFSKMVDFFIDSEGGKADILQLSGGEPTLHPQVLEFIELARSRNIDYVMLNTNGLRISNDIEFVKELSRFKGRFEVYLQFDGFDDRVYQYLRGRPLYELKMKAIENLTSFNIPVTLVTTIENGVNDNELGKIISFGMATKGIRGINFQPVAYFGRLPDAEFSNNLKRQNQSHKLNSEIAESRLTISSTIRKIQSQMPDIIRKDDFIPLPCDTDRVALTYFYRNAKNEFIPLTRNLDIKKYLSGIKNTFKFDPDDFLKEVAQSLFSKECCSAVSFLNNISKILPKNYFFKNEEEKIDYVSNNTFRISITSFMDVHNFDIKSAQKECVHFITPDLRKVPFSAYNMLHRTT